MKYILKAYNIWECGQRKDAEGNPHQEDSIFPAYGQQKDSDRLFILCDGMGGHEAGEVASSTVCSAMSKSIFESAPDTEGDFNDDNLKKAIADAFDALDALPLGDVSAGKKMGTTMTFLKLHDKGCTIAHMGDSRVYHIRPGKGRDDTKILFKTNDHSLVNDLIKIGELTPEEAKLSKQKNIITRAMQPKMERRPKPDVYHTADIKPGDFFYLCSDGMLEQMEDEYLPFYFSDEAGDDENKIKTLTLVTNENRDNHSAIIVHILDVIDPLPIEERPAVTVASVPSGIMAEVDGDAQDEGEDSETGQKEEFQAEVTEIKHDEKTDSLNRKNDITSRIGTISKRNGVINLKVIKNIKLIKLISLALLVILLVLGISFVVATFTSKQDAKPENTEIRQRPGNGQKVGKLGGKPEKKTEPTTPEKPDSDAQSNGSTSSVDPSVPDKPTHPVASAGASGVTSSAAGLHQDNASAVNLNQAALHGEEVVSSDQQAALDAANNGKKKSIKLK